MQDSLIREPRQKRSIEKKTKIIRAGLDLFCKKGYYHTNTVEIAKAAGVSTGTVYSYFKDKEDIYIASFEYFLDSYLKPLLEELKTLPRPVDMHLLIDKFIDLFIQLYVSSRQAVSELGLMQQSNPNIMKHFAAYEDMVLSTLVDICGASNITKKNLSEKMYLLYTLADMLGQEYAFRYHERIDLEAMRNQTVALITRMFMEE